MTIEEKEVYLNGVNVAECRYVVKYNSYCCDLHKDNCEYLEDCDFKKYKRLEQENAELKIYIESNKQQVEEVETLVMDNARLTQENAELKEKNEQLENKLQLRTANDKESDAYWDSIFDEDYPFNKENAYKELCDYYFVLNQLPEIYLYITGGRLSKTTYFASSVKEAFDDAVQYYYDKIDDLEDLVGQYKQALEEIRANIQNWINSPWSCFNCRNNMDERLTEIKNKIKEVLGNE